MRSPSRNFGATKVVPRAFQPACDEPCARGGAAFDRCFVGPTQQQLPPVDPLYLATRRSIDTMLGETGPGELSRRTRPMAQRRSAWAPGG